MKTTIRSGITGLWLLMFALTGYGQGIKISAFQQTLMTQPDAFVLVVVTNYNGLGYNTNFTIQVSNLFSGIPINPSTVNTTNVNTSITVTTNGGYVVSQTWAGPTNYLTLGATNHYFYRAFTSIAVTGFVFDPAFVCDSMLTISNAAATNITFVLPANTALPIGDSLITTVTNGHVLKASLDWSDGGTNAVVRVFKH